MVHLSCRHGLSRVYQLLRRSKLKLLKTTSWLCFEWWKQRRGIPVLPYSLSPLLSTIHRFVSAPPWVNRSTFNFEIDPAVDALISDNNVVFSNNLGNEVSRSFVRSAKVFACYFQHVRTVHTHTIYFNSAAYSLLSPDVSISSMSSLYRRRDILCTTEKTN